MAMCGHGLSGSTAENYRAFAVEVRGRSPRYEELAVADAHVVKHPMSRTAVPTWSNATKTGRLAVARGTESG